MYECKIVPIKVHRELSNVLSECSLSHLTTVYTVLFIGKSNFGAERSYLLLFFGNLNLKKFLGYS